MLDLMRRHIVTALWYFIAVESTIWRRLGQAKRRHADLAFKLDPNVPARRTL